MKVLDVVKIICAVAVGGLMVKKMIKDPKDTMRLGTLFREDFYNALSQFREKFPNAEIDVDSAWREYFDTYGHVDFGKFIIKD